MAEVVEFHREVVMSMIDSKYCDEMGNVIYEPVDIEMVTSDKFNVIFKDCTTDEFFRFSYYRSDDTLSIIGLNNNQLVKCTKVYPKQVLVTKYTEEKID